MVNTTAKYERIARAMFALVSVTIVTGGVSQWELLRSGSFSTNLIISISTIVFTSVLVLGMCEGVSVSREKHEWAKSVYWSLVHYGDRVRHYTCTVRVFVVALLGNVVEITRPGTLAEIGGIGLFWMILALIGIVGELAKRWPIWYRSARRSGIVR